MDLGTDVGLMVQPAAGEPEGFVWKKEVDILDKWDYTLHWVNATCLLELGGLFARTAGTPPR